MILASPDDSARQRRCQAQHAGVVLLSVASRGRLHGERFAGFAARIAGDCAAHRFSRCLLSILPFAAVDVAAALGRMKAPTLTWLAFVGMAAGTVVCADVVTESTRGRDLADLDSRRALASLLARAGVPWLAESVALCLQPHAGA